MSVPRPATGSVTYYAVEDTAPAGFQLLQQLATGALNNGGVATAKDYTNRIAFTVSSSTTAVNLPPVVSDETNPAYNSGKYANRRINPTLPDVCGLNIALLFDLSNSINSTELQQMKTAATGPTGFVTLLGGTPSSIGVYSFGSDAPSGSNTNLASTSVFDQTGLNTVTTKINGLTGSGGATNWDKGLRQIPSGYDLVLVLTDGDPTAWGDPADSDPGYVVSFQRIEHGIASANSLKLKSGALGTNKTRVLGIGIALPTSASELNLAAISGPAEFNGSNATTADYFTTGFDTLGQTLKTIATASCGGTITVIKEVPKATGGWQTASGWEFTASGNPTPASVGNTDAIGSITFKYDLSSNPSLMATITETLKNGWQLVQQGSITRGAAGTAPTSRRARSTAPAPRSSSRSTATTSSPAPSRTSATRATSRSRRSSSR